MAASLAQRRALLTAALGFTRVRWNEPKPPVVVALTGWMDSWRGLGAVVTGMTAQSFNVELRQFPTGWRANFYPAGIAHSIVNATAWKPTPWLAVQRAAWRRLPVQGQPACDGSA
jgi:hypothetical protein